MHGEDIRNKESAAPSVLADLAKNGPTGTVPVKRTRTGLHVDLKSRAPPAPAAMTIASILQNPASVSDNQHALVPYNSSANTGVSNLQYMHGQRKRQCVKNVMTSGVFSDLYREKYNCEPDKSLFSALRYKFKGKQCGSHGVPFKTKEKDYNDELNNHSDAKLEELKEMLELATKKADEIRERAREEAKQAAKNQYFTMNQRVMYYDASMPLIGNGDGANEVGLVENLAKSLVAYIQSCVREVTKASSQTNQGQEENCVEDSDLMNPE